MVAVTSTALAPLVDGSAHQSRAHPVGRHELDRDGLLPEQRHPLVTCARVAHRASTAEPLYRRSRPMRYITMLKPAISSTSSTPLTPTVTGVREGRVGG